MSLQVSPAVWWAAIERAHHGDARGLLELLLQPTAEDSRGVPLPGAWVALPEDGELRAKIVDMLLFGPWKTSESARSIADLMTRTYGRGKPAVSEFEVAAAAVAVRFGAADVHELAESLGLKDGETLRKRIARRKKRREV